ncbi:multidrug ABC transporter ATP-binding protein [Tepiditoga spiralis]|uniref:Multidrug ABC transporter ATP-binding protein n=1 Tax=Tepiditoga spiralis TaxID=2108365 RepID=A0A7G1G3N5_9BACT|nr:ABC transporter ATP-binding protein [Tepiditoga spiralis]BBE31048.1 multidrug ABC transporter ATP-binding protein [Tepiditoga spiralis]
MSKNSSVKFILSFMRKNGGNTFIFLAYWISVFFVASQNFFFNYYVAKGLQTSVDGMMQKDFSSFLGGFILVLRSFGILIIVMGIFSYINDYVVKKITSIIKEYFFKKVLRLKPFFDEKYTSGKIMTLYNSDIEKVESIYSNQILNLLMAIVGALGGAVIIFKLNKYIFIYIITIGIFNLILNYIFIKKMKVNSRNIQNTISKQTEHISNFLSGSYIIKAFNNENFFIKIFKNTTKKYFDFSKKRAKYDAGISFVNNASEYFEFAGLLIISGFFSLKGAISIGSVLLCVQLGRPIIDLFKALSSYFSNIQSILASTERISNILNLNDEEINEKEFFENNTKNFQETPYAIEFDNVSFSYNKDKYIFKDLSFKVKSGSKTLLVGNSGIGKSTILKILLKYHTNYSGNIFVFGKSLKDYDVHELRKLFSYVPQNSFLFNDSIFENIHYGNINKSSDEIIKVSKKVRSHEFIEKLPNKYETTLTNNGNTLSGGQKQRLAIARALLKDAPIFIFDEPTSSLNEKLKDKINSVIKNTMQNKTFFLISHEFNSEDYDEVITLDFNKVKI